MSKEELIELLINYKKNISQLKLRYIEEEKYKKRINEYERLESSTTGLIGINQDIHSKNKIGNKTEKTALDTIELNKREIAEAKKIIPKIRKEIEELKDKTQSISIRLDSLREVEKEIVKSIYMEKMSYSYIGNCIYLKLYGQTRGEKQIKRIADNAIEKMINL